MLRDNVTAYDAAYVALTEALSTVLVTGDGRLVRAPGLTIPIRTLLTCVKQAVAKAG